MTRFHVTVGGARGTFDAEIGPQVAGLLDQAFGGEADWEGVSPQRFGAVPANAWTLLRTRGAQLLGSDQIPNLLALGEEGRGVFLPAQVGSFALALPDGTPLQVASLPGLRTELAELACCLGLPLDDDGLLAMIAVEDDAEAGWSGDSPEVVAFARLALASNEAVRRDCPLWVLG